MLRVCVCVCVCGVHAHSLSAITLENTLVILSTVAPDAGRYYAQAVNDKNGENKTSQPITLSVESKYTGGKCSFQQQIFRLSSILHHERISVVEISH